ILAGDFDGDGVLDLAHACVGDYRSDIRGGVSVLPGNTPGTFRAPRSYQQVTADSRFSRRINLGDFNNDGKLDLATIGGEFDPINILPGNGDGTFGSPFSPLPSISGSGDFR